MLLMQDISFASVVSYFCARVGDPRRASSRWTHDDGRWVSVGYRPGNLPEQGWKLHIAAGVNTAADVLRLVLPVLFDEEAHFKVTASLRQLSALNEGRGGPSQVGKFLTVYPVDDDQAVRLAAILAEVTGDMRGPPVPSDRALRPGSIVHYRYGGFGALQVRTALGDIVPALRSPQGTLVADDRRDGTYAPPWAADPFVVAGVAGELPEMPRLLRDRYLLVTRLHRSPRSRVYLALDTAAAERCILKQVTDDGDASVARLHREAEVLGHLRDDPRFPAPRALFKYSGDWFLAMDDVEGQTLEEILISARQQNVQVGHDDIVRWGRQLADILGTIHARGYAYGDLKPSNVIVGPDGSLRLVDFELASPLNGRAGSVAFAGGTRGYLSPRRLAGGSPTVTDDIYSLGAVLYLLATGAEPSCAPDPSMLLTRPIELLNPAISTGVVSVIKRCIASGPAHRFASAASCGSALLATAGQPEPTPLPSDYWPHRELGVAPALGLARGIGDFLCEELAAGQTRVIGEPDHAEPWTTDVNLGTAGAVIVLSELVSESGDPAHRDTLVQAARSLIQARRPAGPPLPGLYVGEAGVAAALLRAGWVLGDEYFLSRGLDLSDKIAAMPHGSPDMFNGSAGRLRFHLWAWKLAGRPEDLDYATAAVSYLLAHAEKEAGRCSWVIPPGYDALSGKHLLGYAHGAAGIGDAILDLYEVTQDAALAGVADGVGNWLAGAAFPWLADGSGLNWPNDIASRPVMAFWCHGAAGIARFLLHLYEIRGHEQLLDMSRRAGLVLTLGTRWSGPTQCHGLAGQVEALLDLYHVTGEEAYLKDARAMAALLPAFAVNQDDRLVFVTDHQRAHTGFTHGAAGMAACLLRLAAPEVRPHLLSVAGFTRR
jgi:hypothetical protein